MTKRDYYEVLGVGRDADEAALRKAYRSLAMKCHPDRNPDDAAAIDKMKEINEAYAVLCDGEKRRLYDTYGHAGLQGLTQEDIFRGVDFNSILEGLLGGDLGFSGSIFDSLFGRRGSRGTRQTRRGADLRYDLTLTLEEVVSGAERKIEIPRLEACSACQGTGAKEGGLKQCETCRGSGQLVTEQRSGYAVIRQVTACGKCRGRGKIIVDRCPECKGKGAIEKIKEITVHIPKGVATGHSVRIAGEGEPGMDGAESGDLYVVLGVEKHPVFERHGDDIYVIREIELPQAALGGELDDVPGLEGNLKVHVPSETQNGAVLRIGNKGIPHLSNHGRGDEYVVLKVVTPTRLSKEEKELLKKFQDLRKQQSR
jgi:molecular chaperone DnaJ